MAEKVRYYLEQIVPELEDLRKKGVFEKREISSIVKKRTDFEHRIHGRGSKPLDYVRYIEYEMNLDSLRRKRIQRLGLHQGSVSDWAGARRIFFIFDRGTKKFAGDIQFWLQYIEYAKQRKSGHIVKKIFSNVLKLHPGKPELWILAAQYEIDENANLKAARNLLQRGLKFNPESRHLVQEYGKLESNINKLIERRGLLPKSIEKIKSGISQIESDDDDDDDEEYEEGNKKDAEEGDDDNGSGEDNEDDEEEVEEEEEE
ncbi:U3 small nucleolar RNA-associated protein 6-domain-containing protein [Lipomyces japonicus]|uniref:U3 small nucleolar RNA-associated protein 6-domain-containing protein n=1 Tax=Lipomyces japonicus TaxID=56871 RepID=UPI0034CD0944